MNRLQHLFVCLWPALLLVASHGQAQTPVWSDGFETNTPGRWQFSAPWKIGAPTAGPAVNADGYRTHSGANCAHTQGYGYNKDNRLICTSYNGGSNTFLVPSADQAPRLRFWQWFNFGDALGCVEISTNAGDWIQISPTYLDKNGGGVWSRPFIDLSPYAGDNILIAFHFTSGSCCGNALGWFVDDVEVDTGQPILNLPEGFEFDAKSSDWSVDVGTWEIGRPTSGPGRAHSGTNCAGTVLAGNYLNNVDSRLISPPFAVPATGNPALRFWQWYSFNNALGFVEINNNTLTTTTVITTNSAITTNLVPAGLNTNSYQLFGALTLGYATNFTWDPVSGAWTNGIKALGNVFDTSYGEYFFEAGNAPLIADFENYDYRPTNNVLPLPQTANPTNFLVWQGLTWKSPINPNDNPVGFFGTNYNATYSTNATVTTNTFQTTWVQASPTYRNATTAGWTNTSVDLSAYAGETVQVAFHFTSGGINTAPGWYVDDLSLGVAPQLFAPTNQTVYAGQLFTAAYYATNSLAPNAQFTYTLASHPAGAFITNGVVTWQTSPSQPPSTNTITVVVTDNSGSSLSATNSFIVTVVDPFVLTVPPTEQIFAGQTLVVTNYATNELSGGDTITFTLLSTTMTNADVSDLANDGVITWATMTTQKTGTYKTILKASDDVLTNYSATNSFLVVVSNAPPILPLSAQQVYAGQTLDIFITATNPVFPDSVFSYYVTNSPPGVAIVPDSGELTWTTVATNKTQTKTITVVVTDDHTPPLKTSGNFQVTVLPIPATTLNVPGTQTNYAGQQLAVTVSATNAALPDAVYTFALTAASTNYIIASNSPASAVLTWTNTGIKNGILYWTNNSVSPRTNTITVWVQDDSPWTGPATNHFSMVFLPPVPPHLNPPTNPVVSVGQTFASLLSATNDFLPGTNFTFALAAVSTNSMLNANLLTWTNSAALPGIYSIYIRLTDDSVPPIRTTNNVSVTVQPFPSQLVLTNFAFPTNGAKKFEFSIHTPWTNTPWRIEATTNLGAAATNWLPLYTNKTGPSSLSFTDLVATNFPQRYYRVIFP